MTIEIRVWLMIQSRKWPLTTQPITKDQQLDFELDASAPCVATSEAKQSWYYGDAALIRAGKGL